MFFVDSHCHLEFPDFSSDLEEILERAHKAGVRTLLSIGTRLEGWPRLLAIAETYSFLYATIGLHPTDLEAPLLPDLSKRLLQEAQHPKVVGLGETGLDFYHKGHCPQDQKKAFLSHIEVSLASDLPIIVHTRDAEEETAEILEAESHGGKLRGVIHCFTGTEAFAKRMLDIGFYISFSGVVTFKNAQPLQEIARQIPLDRLLLETDAPFLAPHPFRGKRNEPSYVVHTGQKIADLQEKDLSVVAFQTTENFFQLFSKAQRP